MKRLFIALVMLACATTVLGKEAAQLRNEFIEVAIDADGNLTRLVNLKTGHNYASGCYLWRMFYDTHAEREIQILPEQQKAQVSSDGNSIVIFYKKLTDVKKIDQALDIIYNRYHEALGIEEVSASCGYSKSNFCYCWI